MTDEAVEAAEALTEARARKRRASDVVVAALHAHMVAERTLKAAQAEYRDALNAVVMLRTRAPLSSPSETETR